MVEELSDSINDENVRYNEMSKLVKEIFVNEEISLVDPWFIFINGDKGVKIDLGKECTIEIYDIKYVKGVEKIAKKYRGNFNLEKKY